MLPLRLARACPEVLNVDGAGLSIHDGDFRNPLAPSDEIASTAERLQFTQGQGPCLDAARNGRLQVADTDYITHRWPVYAAELFSKTPIRALITVPLSVASTTAGALDLFLTDQHRLHTVALADTVIVADAVVSALQHADDDPPDSDPDQATQQADESLPSWLTSPAAQYRRAVWLAVGITMTARHTNAVDALAVLRAYAYAHDTDLDDIALALIEGHLSTDELQH